MATLTTGKYFSNISNPLDIAEQVAHSRQWIFDRPVDSELITEISGSWCNYRLWFNWQVDLESMMLTCAFDIKIPPHLRKKICEVLVKINERIWLGHFDLCSEDGNVSFRHGVLLKGVEDIPASQVEELADLAIEECERFYPVFQSVIWGGQDIDNAIKFAMFDSFGEA